MSQNVYNQTTVDGQTRFVFPTRVSSVEADMIDCINAGIILVGAAGNYSHKMDQPTGVDYNNRVSLSFADYYYHRGATPGSCLGVVCVGAVGMTSTEQKRDFSNTGPRVDVWAPGDYITSALPSTTCSIARGWPSFPYPGNSSYTAGKVSGTSMAAPQATGVIACMLESRPHYKQADVLNWIKTTGIKNRLNDTGGSYTDFTSLQGSVNNFLYNPFTNNTAWTISGTGSIG
jgi:subtilisin family serine protease